MEDQKLTSIEVSTSQGMHRFKKAVDEGNFIRIYGHEPYFDGNTWIATIDLKQRVIRPTHGYFYPHQHGKRMKTIAKKIGYEFNNN